MSLTLQQNDLVIDCLSFLEDCPDKLNDFEHEFMTGKGDMGQYDSLQEKHDKYGQDIRLSDKQISVLQRLYDKIVKGEDPFAKKEVYCEETGRYHG